MRIECTARQGSLCCSHTAAVKSSGAQTGRAGSSSRQPSIRARSAILEAARACVQQGLLACRPHRTAPRPSVVWLCFVADGCSRWSEMARSRDGWGHDQHGVHIREDCCVPRHRILTVAELVLTVAWLSLNRLNPSQGCRSHDTPLTAAYE